MKSLQSKRALVTGGGRRVGAAIATALGTHGMRVAVHHHSSAGGARATCDAIARAGGEGRTFRADLYDRAQARSLVERTTDWLGGLDLLVLNAANYDRVAWTDVDFDGDGAGSWDRALSLNVTAPALMAQAASAALARSQGSIAIVTCASRGAPYRDYAPYHVSKAAAHQLMRVLALELAPDVRVNAVAPGTVLPPEGYNAAQIETLKARIPLRRTGTAADVAEAVVYLARADWVTGEELVVDGGRSIG